VAEAWAAAGQIKQAESVARTIARTITDPDEQTKTLLRVAETGASQEDKWTQSRSRALVAEVLASSPWYYAMSALASLEASAATSIGLAILNIETLAPPNRAALESLRQSRWEQS
jgi:hypothetical protein